jgi:hypothetical protein
MTRTAINNELGGHVKSGALTLALARLQREGFARSTTTKTASQEQTPENLR